MPKLLKWTLWAIAGSCVLGGVIIGYVYGVGVIPYRSTALKEHINLFDISGDLQPEARHAMKQLLAGGHFFFFDGQDIWMRFQVTEGHSAAHANLKAFIPNFSKASACNPTEKALVIDWFFQRVSRPNLLAWFTPWNDIDPADRRSLEDPQQLDCIYSSGLSFHSLQPSGCNHWWLHNRATGFFYVRFGCYN